MSTYNAREVSVIIDGRIATGFVKESKVHVAKGNDALTLQMGNSGGDHCFSLSNDNSGTYTLHLMQSSDFNDFLSSKARDQKLFGGGAFDVLVKDARGSSLHYSPVARVLKVPDAEYNEEAGDRQWVLISPEIQDNVGGIS